MTNEQRKVFIVGACALLFFLSNFYRMSGAVISPQLTREMQLSPDQLGILAAAFFYAFALIQIPIGLLLDKIGARIIMPAFSLIGSAGAIVFAGSTGVNGLIAGRVLLGIGMASNLMGPLKLFTEWFRPNYFATVSGLLLAVGTLGNMWATSPLVLMVNSIGWRASFSVMGVITAMLAMCFFLVVRDRPDHIRAAPELEKRKRGAQSSFDSMKSIFASPNYWLISGATFLRYGTTTAVQALWAGPFLMTILCISPMATGNILLMLSIGYVAGSAFSGFLSDRILRARKTTLIVGLGTMAVGLLALSLYRHDSVIWLSLIFFAIGFGSSFGQIMYAHIKELFPSHMSGTAMTGINFFTMMGAGVFIHGFGEILESGYLAFLAPGTAYRMAFFLCFVGALAAVGLYAFTKDVIIRN
jgi:MFS family permease